MFNLSRSKKPACACLLLALLFYVRFAPAQQPGNGAVIRGIDASVNSRNENVLGYTVTEHYTVYRNQDHEHPAAEMTVKTTYQKDAGKSYQILNESGSEFLRKQVLERALDHERLMTQPANRATAVITSSNYEMSVKGRESLSGRECIAVALQPKRNTPYLFKGTVWVDAADYAIVQLEGTAVKSPSFLTGPAQASRQYARINGFPMATHAKIVSDSWLVGRTTVTIDYTGYEIRLRPAS